MGDALTVKRAAGAVLRGLKRPETLRPQLAIQALVAAAGARFDLPPDAAKKLFAPALADWKDAVGCADPLLADKHALPIPVPSWCAWLADCGVLRFEGAPALAGPRIVQHAKLVVIREAELTREEAFPLILAGGMANAGIDVHLALSPPFLSTAWRGAVCVRAAAHRKDAAPVPIWLGAPAAPGTAPSGVSAETVATWVVQPSEIASQEWPAGWPQWAVLRVLEGRQPQALWSLPALWHARLAGEPEAGCGGPLAAAEATMRLGVDIGSTSTMVVEEDNAAAGAVGTRLLGASRPSGFRRLAGDAHTAHRYGCAEELLAPGGQLPTALCAANAKAVADVLAGRRAPEELWLPQGTPDPDELFRADRFKSRELLLLSDWPAELPGSFDAGDVSRRMLDSFAYLLGRALAAAHGTPLVTPEAGRWTLRWPRLASAEAVLTTAEPVSFEGAGSELCRGLRCAWSRAQHRMVGDPAAARASRESAADERHPIEAFVDLGGLTLQITVRLPRAEGRPPPRIGGSSVSYLLGGERLIDAAAYAVGDGQREAYRAAARRWRSLIGSGGHLDDARLAATIRKAILDVVIALLQRQLDGAVRRAGSGLQGAGVRLYLLGEGWKLVALDVPDDAREQATLAHLHQALPSAQLHRLTKRHLCEGALKAQEAAEPDADAVELQGVDVTSGQRWFGVADGATGLAPRADDPWWRALTGAPDGSLLRVEQWFASSAPFRRGLPGGRMAYDGRRSVLKQWLDVSGPSLVALRVHHLL